MSVAQLTNERVSPVPPPGSSRRASLLRFSLRELLLVMLACAAFAAWAHGVYEKRRPFQPTHIAEYFASGLEKDIVAARAATGEEGEGWSCAFPCAMPQEAFVNREWSCDLRLPWEKSIQFREELSRRIAGTFRGGQPGDDISASESEMGSRVMGPDFFGDATQYHCGDIHGTLRVHLVRMDEKHIRLIATLYERRAP